MAGCADPAPGEVVVLTLLSLLAAVAAAAASFSLGLFLALSLSLLAAARYDFYTPPRTVVGHNYNRPRKGHWHMSDSSGGSQRANRRMQLLLGLPVTTVVRSPA